MQATAAPKGTPTSGSTAAARPASHDDQAQPRQPDARPALTLLKARRASKAPQTPALDLSSVASRGMSRPAPASLAGKTAQLSCPQGAPLHVPSGRAEAAEASEPAEAVSEGCAATGGTHESAGCVQLRIESLTGLPVNTAAQWYISYLFPGGGGDTMPAEHPSFARLKWGPRACCLLRHIEQGNSHSKWMGTSHCRDARGRMRNADSSTMECPQVRCNLPQAMNSELVPSEAPVSGVLCER